MHLSCCPIYGVHFLQRFLGKDGKLGFHSASIGTQSGKDRDFINDEFIVAFQNRGVSPSFTSQAISHEPDAMWYPSHDELLGSGVVDSIIDPAYLGRMPLSKAIDVHTLEKQLLSVEIYSLLKHHAPSLYSDAMDVLITGFQDGKPTVEIQAAVRETIFPVILRQFLDKAPDNEIWEYYHTQLLELQEFKNISTIACAAFAFPEYAERPINIQAVVPTNLQKRDLAALASAFEASLYNPVYPDEDLEVSRLGEVIEAISEYNAKAVYVMADPANFQNDHEALCDAAMAFFVELLSTHRRDEVGPALRYLARSSY